MKAKGIARDPSLRARKTTSPYLRHDSVAARKRARPLCDALRPRTHDRILALPRPVLPLIQTHGTEALEQLPVVPRQSQ